MKKIKIGQRFVGEGEPLYFIADIAANHDGNLKRALKLIELAKESGADAAKFQNFQAHKIVSKRGFDSLGARLSHQKSWKKSVFEVYQDASIPFKWTEKLKKKCDEVGIEYFTSPYDFESVDLVDPYVNIYKIGSGDITWLEIIEYMAKKGKPIILATGAADLNDVKRAIDVIFAKTDEVILMQCNTNYTVSEEKFRFLNLNVLQTYKNIFKSVILGLSDHTPGHSAVLAAVALGARVFEKHFTDDITREGPDHKFSMTPTAWKEMVHSANQVYQALGDGIKRIEANELQTACLQRRGLRFTRNIRKGTVLTKDDLFPLRPISVDGIPPYEIGKVLGKKVLRDVLLDEYVRMEYLGDA